MPLKIAVHFETKAAPFLVASVLHLEDWIPKGRKGLQEVQGDPLRQLPDE